MPVLTDRIQPVENVRHEEPNTSLHLKSRCVGKGTLYISEDLVVWMNDSNKVKIPYISISLHAICRDNATFPHDSLYLHTDTDLSEIQVQPPSTEDDDDADSIPPVTELYFVPEEKESLKAMYDAMVMCQALHPCDEDFSPDEEMYDVEEEENNDYNDNDEAEMYDADSQLADLRLNPQENPNSHDDADCFEDAEDH